MPNLLALLCLTALSPFHETLFHEGMPDASTIAEWSRHPEARAYRLELGFPTQSDLDLLAGLRGFDRLELLVTVYPDAGSVPAWKRLAARGAKLVALDAGFPSPDEIDRLNEIGFESVTIVTAGLPGVEEARRDRKSVV